MKRLAIALALTLPVIAGCSTTAASRFEPWGESVRPSASYDEPAYAAGSRATTIYFAWSKNGNSQLRTYPATADANPAPAIRIAGAKTLLNRPQVVFPAPLGALWTCNLLEGDLLRFGADAHGNVAPITRIGGSNNPMHFCGAIAVNRNGGVAALGSSPRNTVFVWGPRSSGNAKPARRIAGGATKLAYPGGIAFDADENMFVTNKGPLPAGQSITVYGPNANGNAAPLRSIGGSETALKDPKGIAIGPNGGRIYVTSDSSGTTGRAAILVFPVNARGNVRPIAEITGPKTGLRLPQGLAIDAAGFIYVGNSTGLGGGNGRITVYKPGSTGDVEPIQTIKGSNVDVNGYIAVR